MITEAVRQYILNECKSDNNVFGPAFFGEHLSVVVEYARRLSQILGADQEIVELAGWLHDLAAIQDIAALPRHPILSAEIARKVLQKYGYPPERIERVAGCVASHSVPTQIGHGPQEEVCVSNADAMALIVKPAYWFYFVFRIRRLDFAEGRDWLRQRVESNFAALIPEARAIIEQQYHQVQESLKL